MIYIDKFLKQILTKKIKNDSITKNLSTKLWKVRNKNKKSWSDDRVGCLDNWVEKS